MSKIINVYWQKGKAHIVIPNELFDSLSVDEKENFAFNELTKHITWYWKVVEEENSEI